MYPAQCQQPIILPRGQAGRIDSRINKIRNLPRNPLRTPGLMLRKLVIPGDTTSILPPNTTNISPIPQP